MKIRQQVRHLESPALLQFQEYKGNYDDDGDDDDDDDDDGGGGGDDDDDGGDGDEFLRHLYSTMG